jgi:hypothetical protein
MNAILRSDQIHRSVSLENTEMDRATNKPNCAISSGFAITYYTNVGLGLAGWLSPGRRPRVASPNGVVSI